MPFDHRVESFGWSMRLIHQWFTCFPKPVMADRGDSDEVELWIRGCTYLLLSQERSASHKIQRQSFYQNALNASDLFVHIPKETVIDLGVLHAYGIKPGWYDIKLKTPVCPPASVKPSVRLAYQCQHPMFPTLAKAIVTRVEAIQRWCRAFRLRNWSSTRRQCWYLD